MDLISSEHDEEGNHLPSVQSLPDLSDEVLIEVLYHIHPIDVLRVASTISKRFATLTTSRDVNLRYWRYHPCLPDRLKARIEEEVPLVDEGKSSMDNMDIDDTRNGTTGTVSAAIPIPAAQTLLDRRQLQILCCSLCSASGSHDETATAAAAAGTTPSASARIPVPKLLRKVDLLPSSDDAAGALNAYNEFHSRARDEKRTLLRPVEISAASPLAPPPPPPPPPVHGRCCVATTEDHEHEAVHNVLRALRPGGRRGGRIREGDGRRDGGDDDDNEDEHGDQAGGGGGGGGLTTGDDEDELDAFDATDDGDGDDDNDNDEEYLYYRETPYSDSGVPRDSYDAMWDRITRGDSDYGPASTGGHVTLQFFMTVMGQDGTYWSSRPSADRSSREMLLFATQHARDALITDIAVKPFRELRLDDSHVPFTWPQATVSVYRLPVATDEGGESKTSLWLDGKIFDPTPVQQQPMPLRGGSSTDAVRLLAEQLSPTSVATGESADPTDSVGSPQFILAGHKPVYISDPWEANSPNDTGWQHFHLPDGIVGNLIVVSLNGKYHRQFPESGYYVCVERVECRGVPLRSE
eukprot:CAMPEP_0178485590 /NCGR_PEP_ID=MMETSP0696-20121128/8352_1 /TAXON_ID=265572 /ORGANISM="Extubocellulus spinifer, Strain CCMP396" /LENGTH=578 /DNA_ID=CAMNT_0020113191 /DNA_START=236 /DNA_END=1972 /DNA_ORIENTATION=-